MKEIEHRNLGLFLVLCVGFTKRRASPNLLARSKGLSMAFSIERKGGLVRIDCLASQEANRWPLGHRSS